MGLLPQSPSDQGVLPLASVVPAELSYRSAPLNSCLYDSEREWGDGQLEQLNTCTGREESKRRRGEREGQPILAPPAVPPPPCTAILHSPNPLSDPPGCKFLVCGPNTKIPNPSKSQAEQLTYSHTWPPTSYKMPPLTGPTTHLVSFKLNPHKSPKLSHPSPFPIYPPSIYTYLPHLFPFFFHKATKALALVQSDMQDIYSRGERS